MLPLEGIKVVDFGTALLGAMTGRFLGDLGADVIKIEPLEGDFTRLSISGTDSFYFLVANANKRSLSVNLKDPKGNQIVHELVKKADIVSSNFRPGVLAKFGLDYETISRINPGVVYCSLYLYGETGPLAGRGGGDPHAQAFTGVVASQGSLDAPPYLAGPGFCDYTGATLGVTAILSALFMRERTGKGQEVTTNLVNAGIYVQDMPIAYLLNRGVLLKKTGRGDVLGRFPWGPYTAKDGDVFVTYGQDDGEWTVLCSTLGIQDLLSDPRYDTEPKRIQSRFELYPILDKAFSKKTRAEWERIFHESGQRCDPCLDYAELVAHPQFQANDLVIDVNHSREGNMKFIGSPFKLKGCSPRQATRPSPVLGEHTREVLSEMGYTNAQIDQYDSEGVVRLATPDLFERKQPLPLHQIIPPRHGPGFAFRKPGDGPLVSP